MIRANHNIINRTNEAWCEVSHVTELHDYTAFARKWHAAELEKEGVSLAAARKRGLVDDSETRLLWFLFRQLDPGDILFRVAEAVQHTELEAPDGTHPPVFIGTIEREINQTFWISNITPAHELTDHAYHIETLASGAADPDPAGWVDQRLHEHRVAFRDRATLDTKILPRSEIEKLIRKRP